LQPFSSRIAAVSVDPIGPSTGSRRCDPPLATRV
jgi:hypothetical protein